MQQALEYAEILDVPFVYSTNGQAFLEHDRTKSSGPLERELPMDTFPSPDELWQRYVNSKELSPAQEKVVLEDYSPKDRLSIDQILEQNDQAHEEIAL